MEKKIIKIMPDYHCSPLWLIGTKTVENIPPDELPLSDSLKTKVLNWQKVYDETLNNLDPSKSGFKNAFQEEVFEKDGRHIWEEMLKELKGSYGVKYFSITKQKLLDTL